MQRTGCAGDDVTATALKAIKSAGAEEARDRAADKAAKKAAFDTEYDVGGSPLKAGLPSKLLLLFAACPTCLYRRAGQDNAHDILAAAFGQLSYFCFMYWLHDASLLLIPCSGRQGHQGGLRRPGT